MGKIENKVDVWTQSGNRYYLTGPSVEHKKLSNQVYTVKVDENGQFYLTHVCESYDFDYKIYGLETKLIDRVIKTYQHEDKGNLGVLLNGVKGTGKTVSSKIIANSLNQPTIVITTPYKGVQYFINSIPQNITIFIDEYEKIYGQSNDMLTIMDGAMNSSYRRAFLLTTNKMYIEDNLKQRPSRLRYIKKFEDLLPSVVEEIIDDILINKEFKADCMKFMTSLSLITVDIVKSVINEVNIHNESPFVFEDVFNVNKVEGKYKLIEIDNLGNESQLANNANIYPRPHYSIDEHVGYWLEVNGKVLGRIKEIIGADTIIIDICNTNNSEHIIDTITLRMDKSYGTHYNYAWDGVGQNANSLETKDRFNKLISINSKKNNELIRSEGGTSISNKIFEKASWGSVDDSKVSLECGN